MQQIKTKKWKPNALDKTQKPIQQTKTKSHKIKRSKNPMKKTQIAKCKKLIIIIIMQKHD